VGEDARGRENLASRALEEARTELAVVTPLAVRPLSVADRGAAVDVINVAARWYREFLPPEEKRSGSASGVRGRAAAEPDDSGRLNTRSRHGSEPARGRGEDSKTGSGVASLVDIS
jgi:hypothetical protein